MSCHPFKPVTIAAALVAATIVCSAADAPKSRATIEVIGGPLAGKDTMTAENGCDYAENRKPRHFHSLLNNELKDPKAFTLLQVDIRNMGGATTTKLADFEVSVNFGEFDDRQRGTWYFAGSNPTSQKTGGTGSVTCKDAGENAQVSFETQPQPGITVKGVITCKALRY
jgi:hypothetical protein